MKRKEIIFILSVLILAAALWGILRYNRPDRYGKINITVRGQLYGTYSLKEDQTININNTNTCVIRNGQAYMAEALCPDHTCMEFAPITRYGGIIVCLPNHISIEGVPAEETD